MDVGEFDQLRQFAGFGGLDLAAVLAQLGRDPGQAKGGVDFCLGGADDLAGAVGAKQGVLGERQALVEGQLAQVHVVILRAGGILQGGAERSGGCTQSWARTPSPNSMLALVSPLPSTRLTPGQVVKASMTGAELFAATRMSRSPMVERMRRSDPAGFGSLHTGDFFQGGNDLLARG